MTPSPAKALQESIEVLTEDLEKAQRSAREFQEKAEEALKESNRLTTALEVLRGKAAEFNPMPYASHRTAPGAIMTYLAENLPTDHRTIAEGLLAGGFPSKPERLPTTVRVALSRLEKRGKVTSRPWIKSNLAVPL